MPNLSLRGDQPVIVMEDLAPHQYRQLLDEFPCYVTVLDRHLKVVWNNRLSQQDFGPPAKKSCYGLYNIAKSKCPECPGEMTFRDGQVHTKELTLIANNGERINVIAYSSPLRNDFGEITAVMEVAVNITSVKDIQKQLILLGQTVAGMAHSIKNIMMGLEGGIYVVNKGLESKNQDELKEGWEMVLFNFDKISRIVKDILYCSKEREPDFELVRPNQIAHEVYDLFKDVAARYAIDIKLDPDDKAADAVLDPAGLHMVLSNLVSNAMDACKIDFMKDSHLIEIRTRRGNDGSTIFEVADNGVGIDKGLKEHVFEDFFSTKGDQGTGLGLMVTQKVMREHGGNITFRSRPGQGTTFVATFPLREAAKAP